MLGFLIGAALGFILNIGFITLFNQLCKWQGCLQIEHTWRNLISLPLLVGISMTILIRNYPFRD